MLITEPSMSQNLFAIVTSKLTDHRNFAGGPLAKGLGSIPGRGTTPHMLPTKTLHITTKDPTCYNSEPVQGNK